MNHLLRMMLALCLACAALPAHAVLVLSYHDIRDDVAAKGDPDPYAVSTANFVAHLDWLRTHGYTPVSVQAVLDARAGRSELPDKAVLLTFDDGLRSMYTHVYPLLRAYGYPALVAPVTSWTDLPPGATIDYGPRMFGREDFATWAQLDEMQDSGLVEIASHTHALHRGVPGNPQGNLTPAAVTRIWQPANGYETEAQYLARVRSDLRASAEAIERNTGQKPRVIVWPYAAYNRPLKQMAREMGMVLSFDLEGRASQPDIALQGRQELAQGAQAASLGRLLMYQNPDVRDFVDELRRDLTLDGVRAVQVDLDYVYDPDPAQTERNLDQLVQRIQDIGPSHYSAASPTRTARRGQCEYFPIGHLRWRGLFNRVAGSCVRARKAACSLDAGWIRWPPLAADEVPDPGDTRDRSG